MILKPKSALQKYIAMRFLSAPEGICPGTWRRRTTTGQCRPTLSRQFCWFCTADTKIEKSPLLVVTTGFSDILRCRCTVVVKWWSAIREIPHAFSNRPALTCGLQIYHVSVQSLPGVQLCRAALLGHDAARQHYHLIRTGHGAHPVGDDEDGFVFDQPG